jgi:hypothetical protein
VFLKSKNMVFEEEVRRRGIGRRGIGGGRGRN